MMPSSATGAAEVPMAPLARMVMPPCRVGSEADASLLALSKVEAEMPRPVPVVVVAARVALAPRVMRSSPVPRWEAKRAAPWLAVMLPLTVRAAVVVVAAVAMVGPKPLVWVPAAARRRAP